MYFNAVLLLATGGYVWLAAPGFRWWDIAAGICFVLLINFLYLLGFVLEMSDTLLLKARFGIARIRLVAWCFLLSFTVLLYLWLLHSYYFLLDHEAIAAFRPLDYLPAGWWPW